MHVNLSNCQDQLPRTQNKKEKRVDRNKYYVINES